MANCRNEKDVKYIFLANWIAGIVITVSLMANFDPQAVALVDTDYATSIRMGLGGIEHPNTTAYNIFIAYACGFYLFFSEEKKTKAIILCGEIFMVVGCLLTGSRKVLITIVLMPVVFLVKKSKNPIKLAGQIILGIVMVYFVYRFTQTNQALYNLIGHRISDIGGIINGEDASAAGRDQLIADGISVGLSHLFGVGLNCLAYYTYDGAYAHNEFIEIFADLGIVGFLIYYIPIIRAFFKTIRQTTLKRAGLANKTKSIFGVALLSSVLLLSMFQVTFAFFSYHMILAFYLTNKYKMFGDKQHN